MKVNLILLIFSAFISAGAFAQAGHTDILGVYKIDKIYYDSTLYYDAENDSFIYHYPVKMYRILFGPEALKNKEYLEEQIIRATQIMKTNAGGQIMNIFSDSLMVLPLMSEKFQIHVDTVRYYWDDSLPIIYFLKDPKDTNYTELRIQGTKIISSGDNNNCVIWKKELE